MVLLAADFNPGKYQSLSRIMLNQFLTTSSPVSLLEIFLAIFTKGECTTKEDGTFTVRDFDVRRAYADSQVTGIGVCST